MNIEEILLEDPHVINIHPGETWAFPELDYSLWAEEEREEAKDDLQCLKDFLEAPYIVDDFDNHKARRAWRGEQEEKHKWFNEYYQTNVLKYGATAVRAIAPLRYIASGYTGNNKQKLIGLINEAQQMYGPSKEYVKLSTQEKVEFMRELKKKIFKVFEFLGEQSSI
ncbi:hypothetical protein KY331_05460 [Candidatus Woesearchaeota archaeon]|nr:hypothetical protein [Candidatus Woesearchaeota archaeon]